MTAAFVAPSITEPGLYLDMDATVYHADAALSSSGVRAILECPAKYSWERAHGAPPKRTFEFGHAAHHAVLGVGPEIVVLSYDNYKTAKAQSDRDAARAQGKIPLLVHEAEVVIAMATKLREHPVAGDLFKPGTGRAEVSAFVQDERTGVMLRVRLDWLRHPAPGYRLIIPDYKTTTDAHPDAVQKAIANYGYHIQGAFYRRVIKALGLAPDDAAFVLVSQEKAAPYLVSVVEPPASALAWGDKLADHAIDIYEHGTRTGHWPGYDDIAVRELPRYIEQQYEIAEERGDYDQPGGSQS